MNIFKWLRDKSREKPDNSREFTHIKDKLFQTYCLRSMLEMSKDSPITEGAIYIFIEKICYDLEQINKKLDI